MEDKPEVISVEELEEFEESDLEEGLPEWIGFLDEPDGIKQLKFDHA